MVLVAGEGREWRFNVLVGLLRWYILGDYSVNRCLSVLNNIVVEGLTRRMPAAS